MCNIEVIYHSNVLWYLLFSKLDDFEEGIFLKRSIPNKSNTKDINESDEPIRTFKAPSSI